MFITKSVVIPRRTSQQKTVHRTLERAAVLHFMDMTRGQTCFMKLVTKVTKLKVSNA